MSSTVRHSPQGVGASQPAMGAKRSIDRTPARYEARPTGGSIAPCPCASAIATHCSIVLPEGGSTSVGQILGRAIPVVRFGLVNELHCHDCRVVFEDRPSDSMHSVHHPSVRTQDDRIGEIHLLNEANVVDDAPDGRSWPGVEPEVSVDVGDGIESYIGDR